MTDKQPKTRSIIREIEIDAPIEAVWKALTEAEELTRWFAEEARVTPGVGGSYWVSWGEGQSGESRIEAWEPTRFLRIRNLPWDTKEGCGVQYDEGAASQTPMIQEYTLESRGGRTVLRLVDSGIPSSPDWEGMYDGKSRGWEMFFYGLRHYLEKHRGKLRGHIVEMRPIQGGMNEAWTKLTGPEGLAAKGSFAGASEGTRYSVTTSFGDTLAGEVLINLPPKTLCVTIDSLNDALLSATFEEMGGTTYFYFTLANYGMEPGAHEELKKRWTGMLQKILP